MKPFMKKNTKKPVQDKNMVHLHVHTFYSLLDGESSPERLATKAKALKMPALAITDHNHLLGVIDFKEACKKAEIKPIFGVELYYTDDIEILKQKPEDRRITAINKAKDDGVDVSRISLKKKKKKKKKDEEVIIDEEDSEEILDEDEDLIPYLYNTKNFHILFLAKNDIGYKTLVKLQSEASRLCTFKKRYHCDNNLIEKYHEGLIMTTACIGSRTAYFILNDQKQEAEKLILKWHSIFKDDFYLEIQPLLEEKQYKVNQFYMEMNKKHGIKLVATNDVHYTNEDDADDHDVLVCVGTGKMVNQDNRMKYNREFWLRTRCEMEDAFRLQYMTHAQSTDSTYDNYLRLCDNALDNTLEIESKIENNVNLGSDKTLFPNIELNSSLTPEAFLKTLCYKKLYEYKANHPEINLRVYQDRLKEELNVIIPKGFATYMLVNWECISWCEKNKIPTGPGRGSAAGSLVLFLLNVTKAIDPIKYGLLFFRFLTIDRTALPDLYFAS